MDLFAVIRRKDPVQRVVIFIDEASALGKFKDIVVASGELPGHGASIWSFWQDRSQIQSIYGEQDAQTLLRTAEFATLSDPSTVDPDELMSGYSKKMGSTSIIPQAVRLITGEALAQLPSSEIIVFSSSKGYSKRPVLLNKSHAFVERRLLKFVSKTTKPIFTSNL
jgi:type IV secretion system protein VirD4